MARSTKGWFVLRDGLKLYERTWEKPNKAARAHIILMHGFSDRADMYDTWCSLLTTSYPIRITAFDRRGWGKSVHEPFQCGLTGPNTQIVADINEYIQHVASDAATKANALPLFLMGHSMGGQEALYYLLNTALTLEGDKRPQLSGLILNAPYIALEQQPSPVVVALCKLVAFFRPQQQFKQTPSPDSISRDPVVCKTWIEDKLCHDTGTLEGLRDTLVRESELTQLADEKKPLPATLTARLPCPVLWTHGTDDKAVSYTVSKQLCDRLEPYEGKAENKSFKGYEGWYHQLHTEPGDLKDQYARDVGDWVMEILARNI